MYRSTGTAPASSGFARRQVVAALFLLLLDVLVADVLPLALRLVSSEIDTGGGNRNVRHGSCCPRSCPCSGCSPCAPNVSKTDLPEGATAPDRGHLQLPGEACAENDAQHLPVAAEESATRPLSARGITGFGSNSNRLTCRGRRRPASARLVHGPQATAGEEYTYHRDNEKRLFDWEEQVFGLSR